MSVALTTDVATGPIDTAQIARWIGGARSTYEPAPVETTECPKCGQAVEVTPLVVALMNRRIDRFIAGGESPIRMSDWQCPHC